MCGDGGVRGAVRRWGPGSGASCVIVAVAVLCGCQTEAHGLPDRVYGLLNGGLWPA